MQKIKLTVDRWCLTRNGGQSLNACLHRRLHPLVSPLRRSLDQLADNQFEAQPSLLKRLPANVRREVLELLDFGSLTLLRASHRFGLEIASEAIKRLIARVLTPFSPSLNHLRYLLGLTRAIITGSTVLRILSPTLAIETRTMDLLVATRHEKSLVAMLSSDRWMYEEDFDYCEAIPDLDWARKIRYFKRDGREGYIKVVVAEYDVAHTVLLLPSTLEMAWLSRHGIFCAYPHLTLTNRYVAVQLFPI